MHLKNRHPIKRKSAWMIIKHIEEMLGCTVDFDNLSENAEWNGLDMILLDGSLDIMLLEEGPFLTLHGINKYHPTRRYVTVDRGAVSYVLNGADIMAPGIIEADPVIKEGDMVWVRNPENTGIAIGHAIISGLNMVNADKGRAVESLHHVGDNLWKLATTL
jgi:PUA-domain protein